jgi:dienelactone hydrolase
VQESQDLQRTLLAAWHLRDRRVVQISRDLMETTRLLAGEKYATETDRSGYEWGTMFGRPYQDIWLIETRTGARRKVLEKVRHFYGGSPTGRRLAWYDGTDYWSVDVESGVRTNLSASVEADFSRDDWDYPGDMTPPAGQAGWTTSDRAFLVYDTFDVWSLAPDGSGGQRLTSGAAEGVVSRIASLAPAERGIDLTRPVYLSLSGRLTKKTGYARLTNQGRTLERLLYADARMARLMRADSADVLAFTRERWDDSPDWLVGGPLLRDPRQVTSTNAFQANFAWSRAELVSFTSANGQALQAALYYPVNHDPARRYPMIVYTYERLSQNIHNYPVPSERSYYNAAVWTAQGYFVLQPDIVFRGRDPGVSVLDAVVPAVESIIARGLVDSARVGHVGHSWGGYEATFLPTRTHIFAATVAGAPITNFLSFAGAIHWTPGIAEFDHWETGQARMDVPYWEDLEAYLRNSPAARVHELRTPILMEVGDADGTVDWHQGIEFYNFARRAGRKDFVLLVYPGEDHGLRKKENQVDYHRRINEWFGHYLKGEPAPPWMTDGMTWLERKARIAR